MQSLQYPQARQEKPIFHLPTSNIIPNIATHLSPQIFMPKSEA